MKFEKHFRVTGEARAEVGKELRRRYESGATVRELADETGRSYGAVHQLLAESGAALRARGGGSQKLVREMRSGRR
ncbi:helix-turn-helix domain-containing protein [Amycolatopsis albispora]|uniref:helix-turn-helix domain-containing protein n=1 Tax=Amycolatopsis albispora TaxID=1804986 RepID=UPI000DE3DD0F|nr:helix-turn-helix domain-containing protein [Amycolatopsis albispora]